MQTLPAACSVMPSARDKIPPASGAEPGPRASRTARPHLLLAEDDAEFRALLQRSFVGYGYEVTTACDGVELLRVLARSLNGHSPAAAFAVVVADVQMPGWSGLGVLALLGCDAHVPPIVLITAFGSDEVREQARQLGAAALLDKPLDLDDLCALVDRLCTRRIVRAGPGGTA